MRSPGQAFRLRSLVLAWVLIGALVPLFAGQDRAAAAEKSPGRWEGEIRAFEQADAREMPRPGGVMFYGSSSFRLWTNVAAAFPAFRVVNRGFGGSQLSDLNEHFARVVPRHAPQVLLIYGGDNDIAAGKSAAQVEADFRTLVQRVRQSCPSTRVAFVAIKPSPSRLQFLAAQKDANARVRKFARWHHGVDFLDTASPVLDAAGQPDPRFFQKDRLHLNPDGYRAWEPVIGRYLDRYAK